MKIILIAGMPGSGKTYLAKELEKEYNAYLLDDINKIPNGKQMLRLALFLKEPIVIVTDCDFCLSTIRKNVTQVLKEFAPTYQTDWIFFENNPQKCLRNVERRNDGRKVEQYIQLLTKSYVIPEGVEIRQIYED